MREDTVILLIHLFQTHILKADCVAGTAEGRAMSVWKEENLEEEWRGDRRGVRMGGAEDW